jgi:hypothetical protein
LSQHEKLLQDALKEWRLVCGDATAARLMIASTLAAFEILQKSIVMQIPVSGASGGPVS